jgi:DNA excision repair protein ERCC-4
MMTMNEEGQNTGDIENPTPDIESASPAQTAAPTNRKWKVLLYTTVLIAVIAISVSLGVILSRNNNDSSVTSNPALSEGENSNDVAVINVDDPTEDEQVSTIANPTEVVSIDATSSSGTSSSAAATSSSGSPTSTVPSSSTTTQFIESNGPIEAKVRMIDPTAVQSYDSCDSLKDDIVNALKYFANSIIVNEVSNDWWAKCNPEDPNWNPWGGGHFGPPIAAYDGMAVSESAMYDDSVSYSSSVESASRGEDSYGTNNQVDGVDEADVVKSDGVHVFAAYGDVLYAWDAIDGTKGTSITHMPYNETNCTDIYRPMPIPEPFIYDYEDEIEEIDVEVDESASSTRSSGKKSRRRQQNRRRASSMPWFPPCYNQKPQVLSLLLHESRLTAIVSENNYNPIQPYGSDSVSLVNDYSQLTIRVYDVSTVPADGSPLTLLGERKLKGDFNAARSINHTGIVVTTSHVDTYVLANSLYRSQPLYCGLNNTEYEEKASKIAVNRSDLFADQLINELELSYGCDHIFQISAMQSGNTSDSSNGELLSQFVSVTSFDTSADYVDNDIPIALSGSFASGWMSSVYVSQDFVAALNVGSSYNPRTSSWDQSTFILGFNIGGPTPVPYSVGQVQGSPVNQYAADLYDGHFRIATTQWQWSNTDGGSSTTNKIFVLQLPDGSEDASMKLVGETDHLGKPNESIYAVRFIGDKAYVVTFEQIDPFIVVELSNATYPHAIGELELPGYSSYLHPIEIDGVKLMLGVGQDVNETSGWSTGVKISLFDVSDPEAPVEVTSLVDTDSYSSAEHDFYAFRYLPLSQKLILPLREYTWGSDGNFDGFMVYDVAVNEIKPSHNISHATSDEIYNGCWYNAYMPPRSLVINGKVTTIQSHTVLSTDLEDGSLEWSLNLDEDLGLSKEDCGSYFRYW